MARPTTEERADRNWGGLPSEMKAKVPDLIKQGMKRVGMILNDDKASDSAVLRAFKETVDIYKYMVEEERKMGGEGNNSDNEDEGGQPEGLALISLKALSNSKD